MFGHPKGLFILFFTELWERFSFYGMKAILVLYMTAELTSGGLGWTDEKGLWILGWYGFLVYGMSIPGGIIADSFLGQKKAVMVGGLFLCAGHFLLAYPPVWAFYTALWLIIMGVGMLKPNISTMVGRLYGSNDPRQDAGFTIFYMGINIGAFLAPLTVGYLAHQYGWHYGFALAGIGMFAGQITYLWGQKYLNDGDLVAKKAKDSSLAVEQSSRKPISRIEIDRLFVLMISFVAVLFFWAAFEQAGGLMSLYTEKYTNRQVFNWDVPTAWFQSLNPFFIVLLGPLFAWLWIWLGKRKKDPSSIFKMGLGTVVLSIGFLFMVGASIERQESHSLLIGAEGNKIGIWTLQTSEGLQPVKQIQLHDTSIKNIVMENRMAVSAGQDGNIQIWRLKGSGKDAQLTKETILQKPGGKVATAITISGKYALAALENNNIVAWNLATEKKVIDFKAHDAKITALTVSENGRYILSCSLDHTVKLWKMQDLEENKKSLTLFSANHGQPVLSASISADAKHVISMSGNNIKAWTFDPENGKTMSPAHDIKIKSASITSASISGSGLYILTGTSDKQVKIWRWRSSDITLFKSLKTSTVPSNLLFNEDWSYLVATSDQGIKAWKFDPITKQIVDIPALQTKHISSVAFRGAQSVMFWLFLAYLFHTMGELCLSPVALSFITKIAPKRMGGTVMGVYFAVTGGGNFIASLVGMLAASQGELGIFGGIAAFTMVIGLTLMLLTKLINKYAHLEELKNEA